MFVPHPPSSHVGILTPHVMMLEGGDFEGCVGHEDGALISGKVYTRGPTKNPRPFHHVKIQ